MTIKLYLIILLFVLTASQAKIYFQINNETIYECVAAHLSPHGYPVPKPERVEGELISIMNDEIVDETMVNGKIVLSHTYSSADVFAVKMEEMGALGVIFITSEKVPGRRIIEFENKDHFDIVAVGINSETFGAVSEMSKNTTFFVIIEADQNEWKDIFNSPNSYIFKTLWGLFHLTIIFMVIYSIVPLFKKQTQTNRVVYYSNANLLIYNILSIASLVDFFGMDQLMPSRASYMLKTTPTIIMLGNICLYANFWATLLDKSSIKINHFIKNPIIYYVICYGSILLNLGLQLAAHFLDSDSVIATALGIVYMCFFGILELSMGIFYTVMSAKLVKKILSSPSSREKYKTITKFMWCIGPASILLGALTFSVIILDKTPVTFIVFFWIDHILIASITIGFTLPWFINIRKGYHSTNSGTSQNMTTKRTSVANIPLTPMKSETRDSISVTSDKNDQSNSLKTSPLSASIQNPESYVTQIVSFDPSESSSQKQSDKKSQDSESDSDSSDN